MSDDLKPCPFCGSEPALTSGYEGPRVSCENKTCVIAPSTDNFSDDAEAVAAWNRRPFPVGRDLGSPPDAIEPLTKVYYDAYCEACAKRYSYMTFSAWEDLSADVREIMVSALRAAVEGARIAGYLRGCEAERERHSADTRREALGVGTNMFLSSTGNGPCVLTHFPTTQEAEQFMDAIRALSPLPAQKETP